MKYILLALMLLVPQTNKLSDFRQELDSRQVTLIDSSNSTMPNEAYTVEFNDTDNYVHFTRDTSAVKFDFDAETTKNSNVYTISGSNHWYKFKK
jgi:hypothetical protein